MEGESGEVWSGQDRQKYNNYYMAVPLYIKYFIKNKGYKSDIYLMFGPKLEFLISNKVDESQAIATALGKGYLPNTPENLGGNYSKTLSTIGLDNKIATFGYGLSLVAGVKVDTKWDVFLRFDRGLSKVYPDYSKYNTDNRFLAIGVNYYIGETN